MEGDGNRLEQVPGMWIIPLTKDNPRSRAATPIPHSKSANPCKYCNLTPKRASTYVCYFSGANHFTTLLYFLLIFFVVKHLNNNHAQHNTSKDSESNEIAQYFECFCKIIGKASSDPLFFAAFVYLTIREVAVLLLYLVIYRRTPFYRSDVKVLQCYVIGLCFAFCLGVSAVLVIYLLLPNLTIFIFPLSFCLLVDMYAIWIFISALGRSRRYDQTKKIYTTIHKTGHFPCGDPVKNYNLPVSIPEYNEQVIPHQSQQGIGHGIVIGE